jgi:hypothetical protein
MLVDSRVRGFPIGASIVWRTSEAPNQGLKNLSVSA